MNDNLLTVVNLKKYYYLNHKQVSRALDNISFKVKKGETLGIVGESGCGKSTLGRMLMRLHEPTEGAVIFNGQNLFTLNELELKKIRRQMQIIFQDPSSSLNPYMKISEIIMEPLRIHGLLNKRVEIKKRIVELLELVGLSEEYAKRYPHELSLVERQRVAIARVFAVRPQLLICDELVSVLDVSIQTQIVYLMQQLQREYQMTYIFIAHDLNMIKTISDHVMVMYLGKLTEYASSRQLYESPKHPYTFALLASIPIPDLDVEIRKARIDIFGELPSPKAPPSGCRYRIRCPHAMERCALLEPQLVEVDPGHWVACHLY